MRSQLGNLWQRLLLACSKIFNQPRHQPAYGVDHLEQRCIRFDAAIQNPIQHVLDGPGQLGQHPGAHHPTATLERMEPAPNLSERLVVCKVGLPLRSKLGQGFQHFPSLFDKNLYQFVIKLVIFWLVGRYR